ncbi:ATP-binding protein [Sphingomonas cannabina]|uniref:sensor histidine kinase n=1 Tax=Sphingomonas cannabina TaxID=2899123 RepID=UPI001F3B33DD|nr:ATP-binding protein [Sphingomonas cannabina]UIJ46489.1 ATP-binding protein [Sphingomonas cannabina]
MSRLRSLRALTLLFVLIFLAATVATGFATYFVTHATIARLVDQRIMAESSAVSGGTFPADRAAVIASIADYSRRRDTGDLGFMLTDAAGRRIAGNIAFDRPLPLGFSTVGKADRIKGLTHGRALVRRIGNGLTLTTVAETEPIDNYDGERIRIYLLGFGSIVLIVVGGAILFSVIVRRRIIALHRTADAIIDGDMQRRVPVDGSGSEFDEQAQAFNRMLDRISGLMGEIRNVSNDIAHDLRTPLARLRGRLAAIARQAESEQVRDGLEDAIAQSDAILAMFAAVLRIAEVEGGDRRAAFETLDVGDLAAAIGTAMQPAAEEERHLLVVGECEPAPIQGDRQLLNHALVNLIENALRHTPAGSRIEISVARSGSDAILTVRDDGPGIAPEQRALALRRFGRLDKSRARGGHGLGLPLVDAIARLHRGGLTLESADPGLRAVLTLPLAA